MGVTVKQKDKGKGKPWTVFICHQGKRQSIRVGDKAAAEAVASRIREEMKTGALDLSPKKKLLRLASMPRNGLRVMVRPS
jgi:hypothetical protein